MSQLDDMQRTLNRVVELLERLTGQQLAGTGGVTHTADGMFAQGSGHIRPTEPTEPLPDLTERRRILDQARADRAAARHDQLPQETNQ